MNSKLAALALLSFIFSACFPLRSTETTHPLPNGIPNKEILFVPEEEPNNINEEISTLGFINSDGTGREEYTFSFAGGARSMFGQSG